jgi:GT2 family glycosyltransferase
MRYAFVILHYGIKSLPDTRECIDSIRQRCLGASYKIIVVENGSGDSSAAELAGLYANAADVEIVLAATNLGFANGNNLGCRRAVETVNPAFFIVLNNDTVFIQDDFLARIEELYREKQFDMLGPHIRSKNGDPQNPMAKPLVTLEVVRAKLAALERELGRLRAGGRLALFRKNMAFRVKRFFESFRCVRLLFIREKRQLRVLSRRPQEHIGLHGSALVFSRKYHDRYGNVFDPRTFMYHEEDILFQRVVRDGLVSLYDPALRIYHKEDRSTDTTLGQGVQKRCFVLEHRINSLRILEGVFMTGEGQRE